MSSELFAKVKAHKAYATSNEGMGFYNYLFIYLNGITRRDKVFTNVIEASLHTSRLLDSLFTPSKADFFKIKFSSKDPQEQKQLMETVLPHVTTAWCKSVMTDEYNKVLKKLAFITKTLSESTPISSSALLGKPVAEFSFGARLYKIDAIKADSLLSLMKNSFKDKALLIDFWATWCRPCIHEFPHSQKLSADCKSLPIEFVYLCTSSSSDIEKWKSKIAEYKLTGTHIFLEASSESELMALFSQSGFPSYVLINQRGEYKPDFTHRPLYIKQRRAC